MGDGRQLPHSLADRRNYFKNDANGPIFPPLVLFTRVFAPVSQICPNVHVELRVSTGDLSRGTHQIVTSMDWTELDVDSRGEAGKSAFNRDVNGRALSPTLIVTALRFTSFALRGPCAVTYGIHGESQVIAASFIADFAPEVITEIRCFGYAQWITALCFRSAKSGSRFLNAK